MKIRLIDVDSKIPNFALMKISSYHKKLGDDVDWYNHLFDMNDTDICYVSKIFSFTKDIEYLPNSGVIIKGGTGYDISKKLPLEIEETTELDYSIYPQCDYSIMFTTRGCVRKCAFCLVNQKEGMIHNIPICSLNPKGKWIMVLDNNFISNPTWKDNLHYLQSLHQPIDFNSGIDLRLLTEEKCEELSKTMLKQIHCAWDNYEDKDEILPKLEMLIRYVKPYKITCYVLVGFKNKEIVDEDIERVMTLKQYGVNPFAMGYMDFNDPKHKKTRSVKDFCRWVNMKATFKSCTWEEYKAR